MSDWYKQDGGKAGFGASMEFLGDKGYVIGGTGISSGKVSPWLQLDCISLPSGEWDSTIINTSGVLNRAHHGSGAIQATKKVYVFGGECTASNEIYSSDVIELETSSIFGLKASVYEPGSGNEAAVAVRGLSATVVGKPSMTERIVLFGGQNKEGASSDELWLFSPLSDELLKEFNTPQPVLEDEDTGAPKAVEKPSPWLKLICADDIEGPCPRSFHTCVVAGQDKNLLLVFGGKDDDGAALGDLWMCDLSEVLESLAPVPCVEANEEGNTSPVESKDVVNTVKWIKLLDSAEGVGARYLHSAFSFLSPQQEGSVPDPLIYLKVFGGVGTNGPCDGLAWTVSINLSPDVEPDEESKEMFDGSPCASDFEVEKKNSLPLQSFAGCCVGVHSTESVPTALVMAFNGKTGAVLVTDDTVDLALATKREFIRKIKEAKAAATALANASNLAEEESVSSTGLPKKVNYPNGDMYEGHLKLPEDFAEGDPVVPTKLIRHGRGTMTYKETGEVYTGSWEMNLRVGFGISEVDGTVYDGPYLNDMRHGEDGVLRKKVEISVGENAMEGGKGQLDVSQLNSVENSVVMDEGAEGADEGPEDLTLIYSGTWAQNKYHGCGTLVYDNGDKYTGDFVHGLRHGKGSLVPRTMGSTEYVGDWAEDKISGQGEVKGYPVSMEQAAHDALPHPLNVGPCSGLYEGEVRNGIPWGKQGYVKYSDGSEYLGEWINGKRNGYGKHIMANLDEYEGKFVGGLRCGFGRLMCKNGDVYAGNWKDNKMFGQGTLRRGGQVLEGFFEGDKLSSLV